MSDHSVFYIAATLAVMASTLLVVAQLTLRASRLESVSPPAIARLTRAMRYTAIAILGALIVWFGWRAVNTERSKQSPANPQNVKVRIDFSGPEIVAQTSVSSYSVSSGSVNVGCQETRQSFVTFNAPEGAVIESANATWQNSDGIVGQTQSATHDLHTASASGSIRGRERNLFGDCSGGGHSELVLSGALSVKTSKETGRSLLLKTAEEGFGPDSIVGVTIPDFSTAATVKVTILTLDQNAQGRFAGFISHGADGAITLKPSAGASNFFEVSVRDNILLVKLKK